MFLSTTSVQILTVIMLVVAAFGGWLARDVNEALLDSNGMPEDFPNDEEAEDMNLNREPVRELGQA
tara:strand:- start:243 stop:440 length:198 start_codon:yes stop_codon:yes gene_type:complete